ncbi:hypothetical protein AB4K20DRAFT_1863206 [Rhizopus microsporus]
MFKEVRNVNAVKKETRTLFLLKAQFYPEVASNEGSQPELEDELQREHSDMAEKLKMLKEVVENLRFEEVNNSWKLQVEQLYRVSTKHLFRKTKKFFWLTGDLFLVWNCSEAFIIRRIPPLILVSWESRIVAECPCY